MTDSTYMDYFALVANIKSYSERPNDAGLAAQIPQIILLAENELAADLRLLGNELVVVAAMNTGDATVEKPTYWRATTSFSITVGSRRVQLLKRTYEFLRNFWPDATAVDVPRYYSEYNAANFLVAPTPDAAYPLELLYFARLDPLTEENTFNWFTTNAPQVLLYGCMYHTSLFLKNFEKAGFWKEQYGIALASLGREDAQRSTDRATIES